MSEPHARAGDGVTPRRLEELAQEQRRKRKLRTSSLISAID
jgi:hypothetical protein